MRIAGIRTIHSARNPFMNKPILRASAWRGKPLLGAGIALLVLAPAQAALASTYDLYVATTGNDSGAGSPSDPFRTIQHAASVARPSTTIHVASGDYAGDVSTSVSGSATGRISFVAATAPTPVHIIGSGALAAWTNHGDYVDIVNFEITGPGRIGILNYGGHDAMVGNHVHDIRLSGGCTGDGGAGIVDANYDASDDDVIGNVIHDIGIPGGCNGVQGIYHSNLRGHIYNNIVYRVSAWGIHLWHAATDVIIANNTVFANGSATMGGGIVIGSGDSPGGIVLDNTEVINNIVFDNPGIGIEEYCYGPPGCIGSHNLVSNNVVRGSATGVVMLVGQDIDTITADPQFRDYRADGSGDYRLKKDSPAVDHGLAGSAPPYDLRNHARPRGAGFDIGAYERR
jgi:hypothetical protein